MGAPDRRRRLSVDDRRAELLLIGAELFAERPYDEVRITQVADLAGVSRGLLYHYFPTKQAFAIAVTQQACGHLFADAEQSAGLDPGGSPVEQLRLVLDGYIQFAADNERPYRAMHTGLVADPVVRELRRKDLAEHERRVLAAFVVDTEPSEELRVAVRGWLAFVIAICLDWLERRSLSRAEIVELCVRALLDIVAAHEGRRSQRQSRTRNPKHTPSSDVLRAGRVEPDSR